ncbi:MAG: DUF1501 domain-containing protein [Planctomycetes bacterium]|nr:DUF1501 domain-containing protein [Planctomycetota bacterium]
MKKERQAGNLFPEEISRRDAISRLGCGFGGVALGALLGDFDRMTSAAERANHNLLPKKTHHPPQARAVIQLFMHGGPSQVDLLDEKKELSRLSGQAPPAEVADDENRTTYLLGSPFKFSKHGESGLEFSEVLPGIAKHADDIAVIRSMFTEHRNHEQAIWMANTGLIVSGRPNIGSWVAYGLGAENQNLPAYVSLPDPGGMPVDGARNWSSGWLPPVYQGTAIRSEGMPVLHLQPKTARTSDIDLGRMDLLRKLNAKHQQARPGELELNARIASFELAARMQLTATNALDLNQETAETQQLYGLDKDKTRSYGKRCLMARRLVERGVRFVQIFMAGQPWDTHSNNVSGIRSCCEQTDLPIGGLLTDLKQRGLLESTLILWGGEFGRTPGAEQRDGKKTPGIEGRDHHPYGFSVWLAGGGIRGGQAYGATDDFGYRAITNRTQTADLHATMLQLLGLDHERLTFAHNSRDERLTDVYKAQVINELLVSA